MLPISSQACFIFPTAYCLLPTAYCLLPTAYCLLPTAYCLLPTAYCLINKQPRRRTGFNIKKRVVFPADNGLRKLVTFSNPD